MTKKIDTTTRALRYARAASILRVLGLVENLRLLVLLLGGPRSVAELAAATTKSNYLVARRLSRLRRAGLVKRQHARYELASDRVRRLVRIGLEHGRSS